MPAGSDSSSNARKALATGFLGWAIDAFDFFVLTFLIADIGRAFGKSRPEVALTLTLTLAMRPVGALIFGIMSDRFGRRLPMTINIVFYAVVSALSGLAPTFQVFVFLRMLFGIGMGGQWGVSASLALESISPRWRGVISGLLHQGYSLGNLLAALAFLTVYPAMQSRDPEYAWRVMFFLGGLPALLSIFVLVRVKESAAWREHRMDWRSYVKSLPAVWKRFLYLVLLLTVMGFISHGTQDLYPTFLLQQRKFSQQLTAVTTMISMVGAIFGGLVMGVAISTTGLGERIARTLAPIFGHSYLGVITGVTLVGVTLGFLMPSSMGRAVLLMPIALLLARRFGFEPGSRGFIGVVLAAAFGCNSILRRAAVVLERRRPGLDYNPAFSAHGFNTKQKENRCSECRHKRARQSVGARDHRQAGVGARVPDVLPEPQQLAERSDSAARI